ncbi:hypothetical protein SAMN05428951_10511 [Pseudomonas sp. OV546]|nr:hypothetical protein SAMN05428951_10511 [Pseudomonas sp. OV546]
MPAIAVVQAMIMQDDAAIAGKPAPTLGSTYWPELMVIFSTAPCSSSHFFRILP